MIVLRQIWYLITLCIKGPGGKRALFYGFIVFLLGLLGIQISVRLIDWSKDFYGALEAHDAQAALWQIGIFAIITLISTLQYVTGTFIRQLMKIRWRTTLTKAVLDKWMHNKAYWFINTADSPLLDNPDQRIAEDCRIFVENLVDDALDFFTKLIGLTTYVTLLWKLSAFSLSFTFFGTPVVIDHYIVWIAPIYVLISSGFTHWLGAPLMKLNVINKRREADLRFSLTRFRESKEAIALEDGETFERNMIDQRYDLMIDNWRKRIKREFIVSTFTRPYMLSILRLPLFLSFPAYMAGHVALGGLMQLGAAFQNVVVSLSWFIFSYKNLAELAASSSRLDYFLNAAKQAAENQIKIEQQANEEALYLSALQVRDPQDKPLVYLPQLSVRPGEALWIEGSSGIGKTTLLKTLSGLWRHYSGTIRLPQGKRIFLPQKCYLPLGNLANAVSYPQTAEDMIYIRSLLIKVGLAAERHLSHLDDVNFLATECSFSGGELQRLIIARILYTKPDWVFLDEATSALDAQAENQLYSLLRESLPNTGFIVIAHRKPSGLGSLRHIRLSAGSIKSEEVVGDLSFESF